MKNRYLPMLGSLAVFAASTVIPQLASAANLDCTMHFKTTSWSVIYKHMEGSGLVTCSNGTSMHVKIDGQGVGITAGKSRIDHGDGTFTDVRTINEVLGSYVQGEASAGLMKSGSAQVLTKGSVSLALTGTGRGVDLGISVGKFTISRAK
ncbi:MAG: hypothetical protein ACYDHM_11185 [Acidiferrobacterales bacterium]